MTKVVSIEMQSELKPLLHTNPVYKFNTIAKHTTQNNESPCSLLGKYKNSMNPFTSTFYMIKQ